MAVYVNSAGKVLLNASGVPMLCTTCPCDQTTTCAGYEFPRQYGFSFSTVVAPDGGCVDCANYNTAWTVDLCLSTDESLDTCDCVHPHYVDACLGYSSEIYTCDDDLGGLNPNWQWALKIEYVGTPFFVFSYELTICSRVDAAPDTFVGATYSVSIAEADSKMSVVLDLQSWIDCADWPLTLTLTGA